MQNHNSKEERGKFTFDILRRIYYFAIIGGFGCIAGAVVFLSLTINDGIARPAAAFLALESCIISSFIGNCIFTFSDRHLSKKALPKQFLTYNASGAASGFFVLFFAPKLSSFVDQGSLLLWNVFALIVLLMVNFFINYEFTWNRRINEIGMWHFNSKIKNIFVVGYRKIRYLKEKIQTSRKIIKGSSVKKRFRAARSFAYMVFTVLVFLNFSKTANAQDIVSISQLGYHPNSPKQVVVYTSTQAGFFTINPTGANTAVATYSLKKPTDFSGNQVNCQGNMPCLVGDFSDFQAEGNYYISFNGLQSKNFAISQNVFLNTVPTLFEFFDAQLQQGSSYHADFHSGYSPPFTSIADGSSIMEAGQAALALIRLGSAYRRNPQLFQFDNYNILTSGKPDIEEYIVGYSRYLEGLQGISVAPSGSANAVRLGTGMKINSAFVPGPTNLTSLDVYIPGSPPQFLQSVPVVSLCGANDGTLNWSKCISDAANYYKCQIDEPCLDLAYNDAQGIVSSDVNSNGYAVSRGWGYEFGCYFDIDLNQGGFNSKPNPCHVFYKDSNRQYTSMALLAFLESYPAVNDFSSSEGQSLLLRATNTYNYIKANYPSFSAGDSDSGFFGASSFLLYDYTKDVNYLNEAYNIRNVVDKQFISDATHGNEFYWEEYSRHKGAMTSSGLAYQLNGQNPEEFFRGKIFNDYKDQGPNSMGNNGERVFQFDPNVQFQNSRFILTEGLLASKANELLTSPESFIPVVAGNQLAWLTGMNAVQQGTSIGSPVKSMSFIFGIGDFPKQFHSRWLVDTGYSSQSGGNIIGARGTGYQFFDKNTGTYQYLDGKATILGYSLGAFGNKWRNESSINPFNLGKTFKNGKSYIPGWINGPFDTVSDQDVIFNYDDNIDTYEFTETTNEIVATAIELYAYLDGQLNNRPRYDGTISFIGNLTVNNTQQNNTSQNVTLNNTSPDNSTSAGAKITGSQTTLGNDPKTVDGTKYMREDSNATFIVISNATNTISWYIDGTLAKTETSKNSSFDFVPGILWVPKAPDYSNIGQSEITAKSLSENVTWKVNIENVINPFFSSQDDSADAVGSADTKVHVFVNNRLASFTAVSITIKSDTGQLGYELQKGFESNETDWYKVLTDVPYGNNYLETISLYNNATNNTVSYNLFDARAHYRTVPSQASPIGNNDGSPSNSESGPLPQNLFNPKLVYVTFDKDVIKVNETQTITLDAKNFDGGIDKIKAKFAPASGPEYFVPLALTAGNNDYGTWSGKFTVSEAGLQVLALVVMEKNDGEKVEILPGNDSFYAVDDSVKSSEHLMLVYSVLSNSTVSAGSNITFKIDARDAEGLTFASAKVRNTRGKDFTMPLSLVQGDKYYGTYRGVFTASDPDTTYSVYSLTLSNLKESKSYDIKDRSVYALAIPGKNFATGAATLSVPAFSKEYLLSLMKMPLVPTLIGFGLMLLLAGAILMAPKANDLEEKDAEAKIHEKKEA